MQATHTQFKGKIILLTSLLEIQSSFLWIILEIKVICMTEKLKVANGFYRLKNNKVSVRNHQ